MPLPGSDLEMEDLKWLDENKDISSGLQLIDPWSSSCSRCGQKIRMLNHLEKNSPVEVNGIHIPEFEYEDGVEHLRREAVRRGIDYSLAQAGEGELAEGLGNRYSVQSFLVRDGKVIDVLKDERKLPETVSSETGENVDYEHEIPEVSTRYLGYRFGSRRKGNTGFKGEKSFPRQENLVKDRVYLEGEWRSKPEHLEAIEGRLRIHTAAKALDIALKPVNSGRARLKTRRPGETTVTETELRVDSPGLYSLCEGEGEKEVILEPEGVKLYRLNLVNP